MENVKFTAENGADITDIWGSVTGQLQAEMSTVAFDTWIKPLIPVELNGTSIKLPCAGRAAKGQLGQEHDYDQVPLPYREQP